MLYDKAWISGCQYISDVYQFLYLNWCVNECTDTQTRSSMSKYLFVIDVGWCGWMLSHLNT